MVLFSRSLREAVRTLLRKPGVTLLAVSSLALAIGFSTAAFSILDAYALRELPVREPARLVNVDAMTRDIEVPDEIVAGLRAHFSQRQLVELTVLVAAYNMHARFVRALRIEPEE